MGPCSHSLAVMCWICSALGVRKTFSNSPSSTTSCSLVGFHCTLNRAAWDAEESGGETGLASGPPVDLPCCGASMVGWSLFLVEEEEATVCWWADRVVPSFKGVHQSMGAHSKKQLLVKDGGASAYGACMTRLQGQALLHFH
jgi:hypothetical protein